MARHKSKLEPEAPVAPVPVVTVALSKCQSCGSTRRSDYRGVTMQYVGALQAADGTNYNTVVWRYCNCLDCRQTRCDRSFETRDEPATSSAAEAPAEENCG
jgi:hypothetical protein